MKRINLKLQFNWKTVIVSTLLPLLAAGAFALFATIQGWPALRYDPAYFEEPYRAKYDSPREALNALEQVFKTNDAGLLAEVQGLRRPRPVSTNPRLFGAMLWERSGDYYSYMYWDPTNWHRTLIQTLEVNGRWVVAPEDAYFFLRSGLWLDTWKPIAYIYWLAELAVLIVASLNHLAKRWRRQWYALDSNNDT